MSGCAAQLSTNTSKYSNTACYFSNKTVNAIHALNVPKHCTAEADRGRGCTVVVSICSITQDSLETQNNTWNRLIKVLRIGGKSSSVMSPFAMPLATSRHDSCLSSFRMRGGWFSAALGKTLLWNSSLVYLDGGWNTEHRRGGGGGGTNTGMGH